MQRDRWTEGHLACPGLLPKCPQQPGVGQPEARRSELNLNLPQDWLGPKYLRHHMHISRKLELEAKLGFE